MYEIAETKNNLGILSAVESDSESKILGLIVDGDIRRALAKEDVDLTSKVSELMNKNPTMINSTELAIKGLQVMEKGERQFSILPVVDNEKFLGFLRLHDLVKEGLK